MLLLLAAVPTVFTTWPATWRSGCRIGLDSTTTPTCQAEIPADRRAVATRVCAADPGRATSSCFAPRPAAVSAPINARPPSAFAARNRPSQAEELEAPESPLLKLPDCLVAGPCRDTLAWDLHRMHPPAVSMSRMVLIGFIVALATLVGCATSTAGPLQRTSIRAY